MMSGTPEEAIMSAVRLGLASSMLCGNCAWPSTHMQGSGRQTWKGTDMCAGLCRYNCT